MFYVVAYGDEDHISGVMTYRFIGWTINKFAAYIYNVAGKKSLPFYEHYYVFEYSDMPNCEFIEILEKEWGHYIRSMDYDDAYIAIYDTPFDDYVALSNQEYRELILEPDMSYHQGRKHMFSAYEYISSYEKYVNNNSINRFIREIFSRYCEIFKGVSDDPTKIDTKLDNVASFISQLKEDELPF